MTALEVFDNLTFTMRQVYKIAPLIEQPGLRAAIKMAEIARLDITEED